MTSAHRLSTLAAALWLAACAGGLSGPLAVGRSGGQGPVQVAYASEARTKVYGQPSFTAPVVGVLTRHEKLERYQSDGGFAYVKAAGNLVGWVPETQLLERLPARKPATPAPAAEPKSETPEEAAAPPEQTPPPEQPTETEAEPPEPERSVFDPY